MNKNFIKEMNFEGINRYSKPPLITLTGLPGSGKTTVSRELSKQLGIYLLSNDYVRNTLLQEAMSFTGKQREEIERKIKLTNISRLIKIISKRVPFIFDMNMSNLEMLKRYKMLATLLKYEHISIMLVSNNHEENIRRIQNRTPNLDSHIDGVIGDNTHYEAIYDENTYYEIINRKPILTDCSSFDYVINSEGTYSDFTKDIDSVAKDISIKLAKRL